MNNAAALATSTAPAARPIRIVTHCGAYELWTASIFVGDTCHCAARGVSQSEAVASVVAIFRLA